ncbi:MAG: prepilin-type N-terminal cleavage/methylation domain-containing protein [Lacunisphaera sp.]|nr:prepilin-type N-terminal cleavage/methylation domain-containing protein [Lacunisphaera sp.]
MNTKRAGFSLIEVVLAAGIFAVAVTVILALLPALTRQSGESADSLVAQGLPDRLRVELQRLAVNDFNGLANTIPVMGAPLENGLLFVASRDGSRLHPASYLPPATSGLIPQGQRYFAVEAWRFSQGTLQFDGTAPVLVVYVRVSWPAYNPGSTDATPSADRSHFTFTVAINR